MMTLALTSECNLRCRYCYQNAKSGVRMPWAVLTAAADRVLESTSPRVDVVFAGGEPLLAFDLIERAVAYIERRRADLASSASTAYCLQEKCAWWHEDKCAITQLAHAKTHGKWMQLIPM